MDIKKINFIQQNSPDGGFLQSPEWRKFQKSFGRKTYCITEDNFNASVIEHKLPLVGNYFYIPRGPVVNQQPTTNNQQLEKLVNLAKKNKAGWIRIEPSDSHLLALIRSNLRVVKAPHDMQPRETLIIDITKPEEQLLAEMKSKTRYNIKLGEKKGVSVNPVKSLRDNGAGSEQGSGNSKYVNEFLRLVHITSCRNKIVCHPENYYRKMMETIPSDILRLYVAEYQGKVITANLVVFYGKMATYLHGASDDEYRSVMATYLLQWKQIQDAKAAGCAYYDFGGIKINTKGGKSWEGVTRFKLGFSPNIQPTEFPGSYDIVVNPVKYYLYRGIQRAKMLIK